MIKEIEIHHRPGEHIQTSASPWPPLVRPWPALLSRSADINLWLGK